VKAVREQCLCPFAMDVVKESAIMLAYITCGVAEYAECADCAREMFRASY